MVQALDESFRQSIEYKTWMSEILKAHPRMPTYVAECAIMAHLGDPKAYRTLKNAPPPQHKAPETTVIEGSINISPPEIKGLHHDSNLLDTPRLPPGSA